MGEYNPDWAIVKEEDGNGKLYLVRVTKGSPDSEDLRGQERKKIECVQAHFEALGVNYKVITSQNEIRPLSLLPVTAPPLNNQPDLSTIYLRSRPISRLAACILMVGNLAL
jgi:hypothetical protein